MLIYSSNSYQRDIPKQEVILINVSFQTGGKNLLLVLEPMLCFNSSPYGRKKLKFPHLVIHFSLCMCLTLYTIMTPLKYHVFENIMENGAFALLDIYEKNYDRKR